MRFFDGVAFGIDKSRRKAIHKFGETVESWQGDSGRNTAKDNRDQGKCADAEKIAEKNDAKDKADDAPAKNNTFIAVERFTDIINDE